MNRPYEIPYYPVPPLLGIGLNLLLTGVLVVYLVQTDLLALVLSAGWILAGGLMYVALNRYRGSEEGPDEREQERPVESVPEDD